MSDAPPVLDPEQLDRIGEDVPLLEGIRTTRAIRRLRPDPVPPELLRKVCEAGTFAPSGGNRQPWFFIAVTEAERRAWVADRYRPAFHAYIAPALEAAKAPDYPQRRKRNLEAALHLANHLHGLLRAAGPCIEDPGNGIGFTRIDVKAALDHTGLPSALFWDVDCDYWAEGAVDWLGFDPDGNGPMQPLASGFADGSFGGGQPITRAQDARMVYRLFGEPDPSPYQHGFNDVPGWVDDAVVWINWPGGPASPEPLMAGFGSQFGPNNNITRAQKARQLWRAAGQPASQCGPHGFTDVPPWVTEAVSWLTCPLDGPDGTTPIATGYPQDHTLRPDNDIPRAANGRLLQRFDDAGYVP